MASEHRIRHKFPREVAAATMPCLHIRLVTNVWAVDGWEMAGWEFEGVDEKGEARSLGGQMSTTECNDGL